jgi:hypothetical protein
MRFEAIDGMKRRGVGVCALALLVLAAGAWLQTTESDAARRCAPVVTGTGPGLTKASVLILSGRVDCEKSRKVIFKALSTTSYKSRQINGWDCESTTRASSNDLYGARCTTQGEREEETIKSTVPHRCHGCDGIRN